MAGEDYTAAEARYQSILAIDGKAVMAMLGMADVAMRRNDKTAAISWLTQAVAQDKDSLEPSIRLINFYLETKEFDKAFVEAEMLKRLHPEAVESQVMYARTQVARGDVEGASKSYRSAVRYARFSGRDLLQIASAQRQLKDFEGAFRNAAKGAGNG